MNTPSPRKHAASRVHRPALTLGTLALSLALTLTVAPTPVRAQDAVSISIAAQPLGKALLQLGEQTPLQIFYLQSLVDGLQASAVRGVLVPEQALQQLLQGTGIDYVRQGNTVTLSRPAGVTQLTPVTVSGQAPGTEGSGSYASGYASLGKGSSLRDTPQSISVMTRQRIDDQALTSVGDVLANTTGVTVVGGDNGDVNKIYARGFAVENVQIDGVSMDGFQQKYFNPNLAMYDSVEVIRGADGLFAGTGEPGGSINLVRKRPLFDNQLKLALSAGSWRYRRAEVDATGPLAFEGRLRGRAVVAFQDRDYFYEASDARSGLVYGMLEADLSDSTTVSLGASYEKKQSSPWQSGLPRAANGDDLGLSRRTALKGVNNHLTSHHREIFARLDQQLGAGWRLRADAQHISRRSYEESSDGFGTIDPATGMGSRVDTWAFDFDNVVKSLDVNLSGDVTLLGRRHTLLVGADWRDVKRTNAYYASVFDQPVPLQSVYDFDPSAVPAASRFWKSMEWPDFGGRQRGLYARATWSLTDRLKLLTGARYASYRNYSPTKGYNEAGDLIRDSLAIYQESGIFTPYGGLVYEWSDRWTLYGSAAAIHKSQANRLSGPLPGQALDPITGRNYEIGVKGEHADGRLVTTAALYRIDRKGEAVRDPNYSSTNVGDLGLNCCWLPQGKIVSQGVDLEATGQVLPGWQVGAGYTYNHNQNESTDTPYSSITPKHLFKLWSTYRLPGEWSAWTVGGGVNVQSTHYVSGTARSYNDSTGKFDGPSVPYQFTQRGYAVWNASVQYRINAQWQAVLNLNNVFDKTYYKTVGASDRNNWYGEPRHVLMTLRGTF